MNPKEYKLDIFQVINQIDRKNSFFCSNLTEEEQKAFVPFVTMRWLTGTQNAYQVIVLNELVNPFAFSLATHKDLLYKLMTVCTSGKTQRYKWHKTTSKKTTNKPHTVSVVKDFYGYNTMDALEAIKLLDDDTILTMAEQLGWQKAEVSKLTAELKNK